MTAACCGDRCGFKHLLADGAFLMLSAFCGFGSCRVNDPLAGAVGRYIGLIAALALMPVIGVVILPIRAVAVGMTAACCGDHCGFKHLLANGAFLMLSAVSGFGSCRVNDPLAGAVSRNIGLVAALALMPVIGVVILPIRAVAVGMTAACCGDHCGFKHLLANGAFLMLSAVGGFGSCRVNDPLAGAVNRYISLVAALTLMPVIGVVILPLRAVAVAMCCGELVDDRILAALIAADGTLLMLQAGLGRGGRLVYLPHEGVGRQILCAATRIRAGAVGALMPMALCVRIPRTAVGMGMGTHIRLHGDVLVGLDITAAAAIVILDRYIRLPLHEPRTPEDRIAGFREVSRGAVGIMRGDHHARRVKILAGHVLGLIRLFCDLDALHRLDDLRFAKATDHLIILVIRKTTPCCFKGIRFNSVYGHVLLFQPSVIAPQELIKINLYPIFCIRLEGSG